MSRKEGASQAESILSLVGLRNRLTHKPGELSGGEQQRVALARSLVMEPRLILLDEPLCNLDAKLREEMRGELKGLIKKVGISALYVTHDQEEAMSISDLLLVMDQGVVKQIGSPTQIYEKPADEFVANFIGHINFFSGEVVALSGEEMTLQIPQGKLKVKRPSFPVSPNDKVKLVVRPESIHLVVGKCPLLEPHENPVPVPRGPVLDQLTQRSSSPWSPSDSSR
jgi:ABC-type Fe3+/spermidine/putrescine transport system ATPase subunit